MFIGVFTAIVTPFMNGKLDEDSLRGLIEFQIAEGVNGIVPCGTTGESPTLSYQEYQRVVEITVETVNKQLPVVVGAGSNATAKAVEMTRLAKQLGADATLQVAPYYNKPTQEGIYRHIKDVAKVGLPLMLYNIPSRTGVNITPHTAARLSEMSEVVAIKEASGDITQVAEICQQCGDRLTILSGDDALTLPILSIGGKGVVSVISNLLPDKMVELCRAWQEGQTARALSIHKNLLPLFQTLFMEPNPIPIKTAMKMKGLIQTPEVRLPMCNMSEAGHNKLSQVIQQLDSC